MPGTICPACNKQLTSITGYNQHLVKTTNPACRALYLASQQFHASPPAPDPQDDDTDIDLGGAPDPNQSPLHFEEFDDGGDMSNAPADKEDSDNDDGAHDEWEPPLVPSPHDAHEEDNDEHNDTQDPHTSDAQELDARHRVEQHLHDHEQSIDPTKQSSNVTYHAQLNSSGTDNVYAPFALKLDWEMAQWAKLRGPSLTAFSELISIEGLSDTISLSFKNAHELNKFIDNELLGHPKFKREQIVIANEAFNVYYHDIIKCIKALFSDPNFADFLVFTPEHHYANGETPQP
ncbi:hypothetical protein EDB19DRAFT_1831224 [Suillus lakei]|nr:hypothetical protein EDB19DRAFT_1831224 [Suillus lakei]